jgi:hypothetical protein
MSGNKRIISTNYLPKDRASPNHASIIAGAGATEARISVVGKEIEKMKTELVDYAKMKLRKMMLTRAVKEGMQVREYTTNDKWRSVTKFEEIGESWRDDGSNENAERVFNVTYQLFDNVPSLVTDIGVSFMHAGNLEYDQPLQGKKKGCILEIVEVQKRVLIRLINDRTKRTHGQRIAISRVGVQDEERFRKRKRGVFDLSFVKRSAAFEETQTTNKLPRLSTGTAVASSQVKVNKELMEQFHMLTEGAKKTQEEIQERDREELVKKALRANRSANRSNNNKRSAKKNRTKAKKKTVDPVVPVGSDSEDLPPIMQRRANNIARNNKVLAGLGLLQNKGAPLEEEESSSSGCDDDGGNTSESNDEEHQDDINARLVEQGEEVIEILSKQSDGRSRSVVLTVKWDTGGVSEAPLSAVRKDFPDLVKEFYRNDKTEKTPATPDKKKPGIGTQVQSQGRCTCVHTDSDTFVTEEDARYWDAGCTYHGRVCNMCGKSSRPVSHKKPSYKCVDALAQGCLAIVCHACYVDMIVGNVMEETVHTV